MPAVSKSAVLPGLRLAQSAALALAGTALLTLSAKISVPFYPVPLSMQTLAVLVLGAVARRSPWRRSRPGGQGWSGGRGGLPSPAELRKDERLTPPSSPASHPHSTGRGLRSRGTGR